MERDSTLNAIYEEIRKQYRFTYGVDLSIDKIHEIVESQFSLIPESMENSREVKLQHFGRFTIKVGRIDAINNSKQMKEEGFTHKQRIETFKILANANKGIPRLKINLKTQEITPIQEPNEHEISESREGED
jgi:nucleoid DNA-binding protein